MLESFYAVIDRVNSRISNLLIIGVSWAANLEDCEVFMLFDVNVLFLPLLAACEQASPRDFVQNPSGCLSTTSNIFHDYNRGKTPSML